MSTYYRTQKIDRKNATYNVIFGERSNGKTYALLEKSLKEYIKTGKQFGYVRRWKEDITGRRASRLCSGLNENGAVKKITSGEFDGIHYWAGKFYLCTYAEDGKTKFSDSDVIGFTFALSDGEHDKSTSFPNVTTVIFDEFLSSRTYLPDEFVLFMNVVSTIVRRRTDVKIYMLGNTVNKYCPYFQEMGLNNILKMKQGSIDVYNYGDSPLKVAVEYCASQVVKGNEESNRYFAFGNPKLSMITGGAWELNIYPHLPLKYVPKDVITAFFIDFGDNIYQGNIIIKDDNIFIYIHLKTTPIKNPDDLVYSLEHSVNINYNRSIFKPVDKLQQKIAMLFKVDKIFYQNNDVGDAISNYLKLCKGV